MKKIYKFFLFIIVVCIIGIYIIYNIYIRIDTRKTKENTKIKSKQVSTDLRIGVVNFDTLNPIITKNKEVQNISYLIFEPLISLTYDYKLEPCLAKEWTKVDNNVYLIKLKENIKWHDGNKFSANDVIFTINSIKKIKENSMYYCNVEDIIKVQKIDELTIKIITNNEIPYFEYNLIFPIISSKYNKEENFFENNEKEVSVGTGKYYISDINREYINLKQNTKWWNNKKIKISDINVKLYKNLSEEIKDVEMQKIDLLTTSEININIDEYKNNIKEYIVFNNDFKSIFKEIFYKEEKNYENFNEEFDNNKDKEEHIGNMIKKIEESHNKDDLNMNISFEKNIIIYSQKLKGQLTPNAYSIFYNMEDWYREYDKRY